MTYHLLMFDLAATKVVMSVNFITFKNISEESIEREIIVAFGIITYMHLLCQILKEGDENNTKRFVYYPSRNESHLNCDLYLAYMH